MRTGNDEGVGYGRPPKHSQWKKGQSGNPRGPRRGQTKKVAQMIEDIFATEIDIVENGIPRRVTVFEAILLQLWMKAMAGNARAMTVLHKYEALAQQRPEYWVVTEEQARQAAAEYAAHLK